MSLKIEVGENVVRVSNSLDLDETPTCSYSAFHPDLNCQQVTKWLFWRAVYLVANNNQFKEQQQILKSIPLLLLMLMSLHLFLLYALNTTIINTCIHDCHFSGISNNCQCDVEIEYDTFFFNYNLYFKIVFVNGYFFLLKYIFNLDHTQANSFFQTTLINCQECTRSEPVVHSWSLKELTRSALVVFSECTPSLEGVNSQCTSCNLQSKQYCMLFLLYFILVI